MGALAIIPARGGSKGIPRKNVLPFCGKPLIAWTIEAALQASTIERVVVSTDDEEIAAVSRAYGAEVIRRPSELSGDNVPSELALLHALERLGVSQGRMAFLQCTSPLTLPADIDGAVNMLDHADSVFTACPWHHFLWQRTSSSVVPLGHSRGYRPMRQHQESHFLEVGAVYALRIETFIRAKNRFSGRLEIYPIAPERAIEIDNETDFLIAQTLMRQRLNNMRMSCLPKKLGALIMDFDGVLTNNQVQVNETGQETVACHRGDGWAIRRLQEMGVPLLVLTSERNPVVRMRCDKLGIECLVANRKLPALKNWLIHRGIDPRTVVYVGNDAPDVECMLYVGCGVAPADAYPVAKQAAQVVLETQGGCGCIRELFEWIAAAAQAI